MIASNMNNIRIVDGAVTLSRFDLRKQNGSSDHDIAWKMVNPPGSKLGAQHTWNINTLRGFNIGAVPWE
jgi:hypothetical protein